MTQILIVEDEQNLARFLELELTHENYNVDTEYDGQDGLDKALSHYYDLIILGVASGKCGFTTLRISKYKKPKFLAK